MCFITETKFQKTPVCVACLHIIGTSYVLRNCLDCVSASTLPTHAHTSLQSPSRRRCSESNRTVSTLCHLSRKVETQVFVKPIKRHSLFRSPSIKHLTIKYLLMNNAPQDFGGRERGARQ